MSKKQVPDTASASLARTLRMAEESREIGVNTLVKMDQQTDQMRRIKADAEDTEDILKGNRKVVKDMRRCWMIRLCCYNRNDIVPTGPTWDNRETDEEQMRVRRMIKMDKRRRKVRRALGKDGKPRKEGDNEEEEAEEPQVASKKETSSKWKFWKKRDSSSDSEDSELTEEETGNRVLPRPPVAPKVDTRPTLVDPSLLAEYPDEETALDTLDSRIQDLKMIALQMSETSQNQTAVLNNVHKQVDRNQAQLDRNQHLIGKLGKRPKEDGDDGLLSAHDKLAIAALKSSIETRTAR